MIRSFIVFAALQAGLAGILQAQSPSRPPLRDQDITDIATLLRLEDTRTFDSTALARISRSSHSEVRRRAAMSLGRIVNPRGRALVRAMRGDADSAVLASVAFATAQLYDTSAIGWLDSTLTSPRTPPTVATEAARALGMIRTPESRAVLARYLNSAGLTSDNVNTIGEALLSIGRHTGRADLGPITRWSAAPSVQVRWRAAWALFRPRDSRALQTLLEMSQDSEAEVRNWAVRGLTVPQVDSAQLSHAMLITRLGRMLSDPDRGVRTEVLRTLGTYPDSSACALLTREMSSTDSWYAVSAAEGLGRHRQCARISAGPLTRAARTSRSYAIRSTALTALVAVAPDSALAAAVAMSRDTLVEVRVAAVNVLRTRAADAREVLATLQNDPASEVSGPARQAYLALTDTAAANAAAGAGRAGRAGGAASAGGRAGGRGDAGGAGAAGGRAGGGGGAGRGRGQIQTWRIDANYREIVERWIVPDYQGRPRPRVEWTTPRGSFEMELYAGDAPIATDDLIRNAESWVILGVDFSRVVPDFVAQQRGITGVLTARDEVNRHRLTRGNLAWASAGLDTGRPGYTLGHTAQPHNEGGFTSLGRVVRGMDVVDRIELGDRITGARVVR